MPSTIACSPGDVVLVPFVFTDQQGVKNRPAVVMSVPAYHAVRADAILMPLTSQATTFYADVALVDWQAAGLVKATFVKACLQTIEQAAIVKKLGVLSATDLAAAQAAVRLVLGL